MEETLAIHGQLIAGHRLQPFFFLYNQPSAGFSHISMVPNEITQNKTICDNSHITLHVIKIELLFKLKCHIKHFHTSTFIEQEYTIQ